MLGQERIQGISDANPNIEYRWINNLEEASHGGGVCIVSTRAPGRAALIKKIASELGYKSFLVEKLATQSVGEYEDLLKFQKENNLSVWVNCKTRAYPFHLEMIRKFNQGEPLQFSVVAGNHGLASNGIHSVDLFNFYDGCSSLNPTHVQLDPVLHESKRRGGLYDVSGVLEGVSENGSRLSLSFSRDHSASDCYFVSSKTHRFILDQSGRWAVESDAKTGWVWRPIEFTGNLLVSNMTKAFVRDILKDGRSPLPTLEECFLAHAFIFNALQPHFSKILGKQLELCPVT